MSRKVVLSIVGGLGALALSLAGAGYYWWETNGAAWSAEMRAQGQKDMAEGKAVGEQSSKEQCVRLAMQKLTSGAGIMEQVRIELFLESCLNAAQGELAFCKDAPGQGEILASVAWRLKTSRTLGLGQSENPIVKGIQKHCAPLPP
jgi:hypothetical protein